ncbi:MAG: hypothetical protein ACLGIR_03085 [Actinomycetes bacterium]
MTTRHPEPAPTVPSRRRNLLTVGALLGVVALGLAAGRWITTAAPFVAALDAGADVRLAAEQDTVVLVLPLRDLLREPDAPEVRRLTLSSVALVGDVPSPDAPPEERVEEVERPGVCVPPATVAGAGDPAAGPCGGADRRDVSGARVTADDVLVLPLRFAPAALADGGEVCVDGVRVRFRDGVRTGDQRIAVARCLALRG